MNWQLPPGTGHLTPGVTHVWAVDLSLSVIQEQLVWAWLSADERLRAERFRFPVHKRRFIAARGALRFLLSHYLSCEPQAIQFSYTEHGKPYLANSVQFNTTDSEDLALLAFSDEYPIGIDVEYCSTAIKALELAQRFFSAQEGADLHALPLQQRLLGFYQTWTRKEAFVKALGLGLAFPLAKFSVKVAPDEPAQLLQIDAEEEAVSQWQLINLTPKPNFAAALAVRTPHIKVKEFGLSSMQKHSFWGHPEGKSEEQADFMS